MERSMTIWGDTDTEDIPDNPFHIAENTYKCLVVDCYEQEKNGVSSLVIKWNIDEPDSQFNDLPVTEKHTLFKKPVPELSGKEVQRLSFTKKRLREAFDLTPDELKNFRPKDALGKVAYVHIINTPDKADHTITYNNVRSAISPRLMEEQNGQANSTADLLDI